MKKNNSIKPKYHHAFSLIELMVVVALIGILASLAAPIGIRQVQKGRVDSAANAFSYAWQFARAEAVRRKQTVTLCAIDPVDSTKCLSDPGTTTATLQKNSQADFGRGWAIFVGTTQTIPTDPRVLLSRQSNLGVQIKLRVDGESDDHNIAFLRIDRGGAGFLVTPTSHVGVLVAGPGAAANNDVYNLSCFGLNGESSAAAASTVAITSCISNIKLS